MIGIVDGPHFLMFPFADIMIGQQVYDSPFPGQ